MMTFLGICTSFVMVIYNKPSWSAVDIRYYSFQHKLHIFGCCIKQLQFYR
eukprot:TRINITY_DN8865_c0_g1_i1.p2 TRINITY_DN8865_c0_g1~~TRINITY_DN8865_c0_g1_i1.p2  ORF type:complete len:50 (+),score=1.86 TRINITY_DN8865_c0_g1_i1:113-262(+)